MPPGPVGCSNRRISQWLKPAKGSEQGNRIVSASLPPNIVSVLEARAEAEDRSLSQVVRRALTAALHSEVR